VIQCYACKEKQEDENGFKEATRICEGCIAHPGCKECKEQDERFCICKACMRDHHKTCTFKSRAERRLVSANQAVKKHEIAISQLEREIQTAQRKLEFHQKSLVEAKKEKCEAEKESNQADEATTKVAGNKRPRANS